MGQVVLAAASDAEIRGKEGTGRGWEAGRHSVELSTYLISVAEAGSSGNSLRLVI